MSVVFCCEGDEEYFEFKFEILILFGFNCVIVCGKVLIDGWVKVFEG